MTNNTHVPEISKAVMIIHEMSADEKVQEIARIREKALHDEATALGHARREGMAEGEQIGMRKGRAEGEQIGMRKGRAEGEQIGMRKGRAELIEAMRRSGMTEEQIQAVLKS